MLDSEDAMSMDHPKPKPILKSYDMATCTTEFKFDGEVIYELPDGDIAQINSHYATAVNWVQDDLRKMLRLYGHSVA